MVGATQHHVSCTCTHGRCYATSWGGVGLGWGGVGMITFFALAHMVGATQHHVSCTCTHDRCYATSCFLHLHTWSVLRNIMGWGGVGVGWGGDDNILCTCTHGWCYATSCFLHLHTWSVLRNIMFLALAHMVGATQHHVVDQNSINLFRRLVGDEVWLIRLDCRWQLCRKPLCSFEKTIETHQFEYCSGAIQDWAPLSFEFTLFKQSSRLGTHHASTAVPQNEMHVWLGVSHRCFQKTFVATLTHVLQEKRLTVMLLGPQIHCK